MRSHFRPLFLLALLFATGSALAQANCYAYRTKGGDAFEIACYPNAAACNTTKADYVKKTPNIEATGCAAQIYCFTYNAGGKSSVCYMGGDECVKARNDLASRAKDVGACVSNTTAGRPKVQLAQVAPPPPPGMTSGQAKPPAPPPPPGMTSGQAKPPAPPPPPGMTSGQAKPPAPPPPPGMTSGQAKPPAPPPPPPRAAGGAPVCNPATVQLKLPPPVERCFGAIGQACKSQVERGVFQLPPASIPLAKVTSDCTITVAVSVGSILHDNCCQANSDGLYCSRDPGARLADETSNLACHREWRKAVYDVIENRFWFERFGPYFENNNGDDMGAAQGARRRAVTYGPLGVQDTPSASDVTERAASRRLTARSGQKLEIGDVAFCSSGRFSEERWCAPVPGNLACSGTKALGGKSFAAWKAEKKKECDGYWATDPRKVGCEAHIVAEEGKFNNRNSHWGICQ